MTNTRTDTQIRKPSFKSPSSSPSLRASCNSCLTDLTGNGWQLPSTSFIDPFYTHVTHVSEVSLLHMRHHQPVRVHVWMSQHHSIIVCPVWRCSHHCFYQSASEFHRHSRSCQVRKDSQRERVGKNRMCHLATMVVMRN